MNEKVDVLIYRRRLTIEMEGLTPMEILALAGEVTAKMEQVAAQDKKLADSSKIATLAALDLAADLMRLRDKTDTETRTVEHKLESMSLALSDALSAAKLR